MLFMTFQLCFPAFSFPTSCIPKRCNIPRYRYILSLIRAVTTVSFPNPFTTPSIPCFGCTPTYYLDWKVVSFLPLFLYYILFFHIMLTSPTAHILLIFYLGDQIPSHDQCYVFHVFCSLLFRTDSQLSKVMVGELIVVV